MNSTSAATDRTPSPSRRRFLRNTLATGVAFAGAFEYSYAFEANHFEVVPVDLSLHGTPKDTVGLRIGQLSDMHCDSDHSCRRTERAAQLLLEQKPDIVFLTGDYITVNPNHWAPKCAGAQASLTAAPKGVYAVMGNHDWGPTMDPARIEYIEACLTDVGINVLRNTSLLVPGLANTWIVGLDDMSFGQTDAQAALLGVPTSAFKILLVHEPDYADQSPPGFALQLSGHSHGGQVRIPGLPPMHLPPYGAKYYEGLNQSKTHLVYTTRGVGTVGIPVRAFCRPEVTVVTLS